MAPALFIVAAVAATLAQASPPPQPLPRRAPLGVYPAAPPPPVQERIGAGRGALITRVLPDANAASLGIKVGDVVMSFNGEPINGPADLVSAAGRVRDSDRLDVAVWRDGRTLRLTGRARGTPRESYAGATTAYSSVPFQGGRLSEILVLPEGKPDAPVVYYIQGVTCISMEAVGTPLPYGEFVQGMVDRGVGVYRVEKPGMGDSRGGPVCQDIGFQTELAAFEAGYTSLLETHHVNPDRVFMFGHSMGGLEAPLMAAKRPPRGVAVYGAVVRNWADYIFDVVRWQSFEIADADPVEAYEFGETLRDALQTFYLGRRSPDEIAASDPAKGRQLRDAFNWTGGPQIQARHYSYWQEIAQLHLVAAWRDTRSNVLSLYGASDTMALTGEDQERIARIVNHYRPGTARYEVAPDSSHIMTLVGDRDEARRRFQAQAAGEPVPPAPFNRKIVTILADWIEASMAKPPVRLSAPA